MWRKATIGGLAALAIVAGGAGVTIAQAAQTSDVPSVATADPTPAPSPSPTAHPGQGRQRPAESPPSRSSEGSRTSSTPSG